MPVDITFIGLIAITVIALVVSLKKDKSKTVLGLKIAKGRLFDIAGDIIGILALIALFLALVPQDTIRDLLGGDSALLSTLFGAGIGTVAIIPAFVAFPLSASLVDAGAHLVSVAAFITTLTMVGFITAPVEIKFFGKKFTLIRNLLSFLVAIVIAIGVGVLL